MSESIEGEGSSIRNLDTLVSDGERTISVGAPAIGKSDHLNNLGDGVVVVRGEADLPATGDGPLVLDDFYDLFLWYCRKESEERRSLREQVQNRLNGDGEIFVCTTPYRLWWILEHYRDDFEELLGGLTDWTVQPLSVDEQAAREFLQRELDNAEQVTEDNLRETEWTYDLDEQFKRCLRDDECFGDIFEQRHYTTLNPGVLTGSGPSPDIDALLDTKASTIETVRVLLGDVAAGGALDPSGTIDQARTLIGGAREFAGTLIEQGAFDTLKDGVQSVLGEVLPEHPAIVGSTVAGAVSAVSAPAVAIGCVGYLMYATRKENEQTKEAVREEFRSIIGSDLLELTPAEREVLEEAYGLEPKTMLYLNRVVSGVTSERLDQTVERLNETVEQVDELERTVERHETTIETVINWIRMERRGPKVYQTFREFERELYETPDYKPPTYEMRTGVESSGDDGEGERKNAQEKILNLLDRDEESITIVSGESGIGKSRLLAEVGRELRARGNKEIWYVQNPAEVEEPPLAEDTVLFLDELGQMRYRENFLELAAKTRRTGGAERQVNVVAAVRPVYEDEIETSVLPGRVPRYNLKLERLDDKQTIELLSDFDISPETAVGIHETTDGNPFLSRLLALAEQGDEDASRSFEEKIREVIERTMLSEAGNLEELIDIEDLLIAIAVLGEYSLLNDAQRVSEFFDIGEMGTQRGILGTLDKKNYLTTTESPLGSTTYTHEIDIFAEYLRWQVLVGDEDAFVYQRLIEQCISTSPASIAAGLVDLYGSSLDRFEFFDREAVNNRVRHFLSKVATGVVDTDVSIDEVLRVQIVVGVIAPDVIPHQNVIQRYADSEQGENTAKYLFHLASLLYTRSSNIAELAGREIGTEDLLVSSPELSESAQMWLNRLGELADNRSTNPEIQLQFAKGLVGAIEVKGGGEAEELKEIRMDLEQLEELAENHPADPEIQLMLAKGLFNTMYYEREAKDLSQMRARLERLYELAKNHLADPEIQLMLAKSLVNAIGGESDMGELKEIRLDVNRLKKLAENYPADPEIQLQFAKGLVDTITNEEEMNKFPQMRARLDQLEELAENHPADPEIQLQFAKGLVNAINGEGKAGEFPQMRTHPDRLEEIAENHSADPEIQLEFAQGLVNTIYYEGDSKKLNEVRTRLKRLEELAESHSADSEIQLKFAEGLVNAIRGKDKIGESRGIRSDLSRLESLAESHSTDPEVQLLLAKGLFNAIVSEDEVRTDLNRLKELAESHPEIRQFHKITKVAHIVVVASFLSKRNYRMASEIVQALRKLTNATDELFLGSKSEKVQKSLREAHTQLIHDGRLNLLANLTDVLREVLTEGQWEAISADAVMMANRLLNEGDISMETYQYVVEVFTDR
jgi:hypothetical protein